MVPKNPVRSVMYRINDTEFPAPGAPSMYRAFLAYLYSVACNLFEVFRDYDPLSPTCLPLRLEPDLN